MKKKYHVTLTEDEQEELVEIIRKRSEKSLPVKRAYILLSADENGERCWKDERIACKCGVGARPAERRTGLTRQPGERSGKFPKKRFWMGTLGRT